MTVMLRLVAAGAAGAAMIALLGLALPSVDGTAAFEDVCRLVLAEPARGEQIDARLVAVSRCREGKGEVTRQVAVGRLGLAEAADRFIRLDEELDNAAPGAAPPLTPARARQRVIMWVASELQTQPRKRAAVVARLEREGGRLEAGALTVAN